ncbi:8406_t:CDS:2 [Diversispora eburnea]|uniref:8406_t:CDS:1 n=1 Tax=Diversispora eburnea TaxID=1213867 RepID=A0A9N8Z2B0_9GLOM|nr:8406_t:CDS:2 [Diversispora eburnea]
MVIGPVLGYFDQIIKFRKTKSSAGFSSDTSGILLVSRIGKRFDIILLYQSIMMIIAQTWLLHECIKYRFPSSSIHNRKRWFWNWHTFTPYMICLASVIVLSSVPMPQAWQNYQNRSVVGFSSIVLITWFIGDAFKTFYYTYTKAPLQFILCGIIQLCVDSIIALALDNNKEYTHALINDVISALWNQLSPILIHLEILMKQILKKNYMPLVGVKLATTRRVNQGPMSGVKELDDFLNEIQHKITTYESVIEWIPFERLENLKEIGKGGFNTVHLATWIDEIRTISADYNSKNFAVKRVSNCTVTLKILNNAKKTQS